MVDTDNLNTFASIYFVMSFISQLKQITRNFIQPMFTIFLHYFFNYNKYNLNDKENIAKLLKNIKNYYAWSYDDDNVPDSIVVHKQFVPEYLIQVIDNGYECVIFCKYETLNELIKNTDELNTVNLDSDYIPIKEDDESSDKDDETNKLLDKKNNALTYVSKGCVLGDNYVQKRDINMTQYGECEFYDYQNDFFINIMNFYKNNNYCKAFLTGNPGQGKTYFNYIMAQKLNCYLCDSFNPTEPGSSLAYLYNKIGPTSTKPLIVVFDEFDILIEKIHKKQIQSHKKLKVEVQDKITWNNFIDKISYKMMPHLIIIMITNQQKSYFDWMDKSYLREGRIDIFAEWK